MTPKPRPPEDRTDDELRAEYHYWDRYITNAEHWGAAVGLAIECRKSCLRLLAERELVP